MIRLRDKSSSGGGGGGGGGLMRGIKIPPQDFALKMPGGVFAGHYGITKTKLMYSESLLLECSVSYSLFAIDH